MNEFLKRRYYYFTHLESINLFRNISTNYLSVTYIINLLVFVIIPVIVFFVFWDSGIGLLLHTIILSCLSMLSMLYIFFNYHKISKIGIFFYYFSLIGLIFIYSNSLGLDNEIEVFYIPILFSLQLSFTDQKEKIYSYIIVAIALCLFIVSQINEYQILKFQSWHVEYSHRLRLIAYLYSIALILLTGRILHVRDGRIIRQLDRTIHNQNTIEELTAMNSNLSTYEKSILLMNLIKTADSRYISLFTEFFPDFLRNILKNDEVLSENDFRLCSYIKLGLSTKEIATATGFSVRTIQAKKNQLRKILNVPSDINLYNWIEGY